MIAASYFFFFFEPLLQSKHSYLFTCYICLRCLWWEPVPLPHQPWPPSFPTPSTYLNMINLLQEYTTKTKGKLYFSSVSLCVIMLILVPT